MRRDDIAASFTLHWVSPLAWRRLIDRAGFDVEALYGWFDRRAFDDHEDTVWVCRRRD